MWDQVQRRLERHFDRANRAKTETTAPALAPAVEQAPAEIGWSESGALGLPARGS